MLGGRVSTSSPTISRWERRARIRQSGSDREPENHSHLFFLNHHTVNPVATNVTAIAISYP